MNTEKTMYNYGICLYQHPLISLSRSMPSAIQPQCIFHPSSTASHPQAFSVHRSAILSSILHTQPSIHSSSSTLCIFSIYLLNIDHSSFHWSIDPSINHTSSIYHPFVHPPLSFPPSLLYLWLYPAPSPRVAVAATVLLVVVVDILSPKRCSL